MISPVQKSAKKRDEHYVIDLCDRVLGRRAQRQARFDWLRGDKGHYLPVDAWYEDLRLLIEYHERQHAESVVHWDQRMTCSDMTRDKQRRRYDQRRRDKAQEMGLRLIELKCTDFAVRGKGKLRREYVHDEAIVRDKLSRLMGELPEPPVAKTLHG